MNVRIEKIEIVAFGKLKNTVVTAHEGINLLSAPNESGKSTLAAFLKFAFYGFVGGRMQSLSDNERKLYTPWDSEVSEGSVDIVADGTKYNVHRRCPPSGKETVTVTNRQNGRAEFIGLVPGEVFFGVGEDVFARTLFLRQLTVPQGKDELLADRLRNIAISADEQVGTKKAIASLSEAKNEIKGKVGSGLLPKAQRERDEIEESLTASIDLRREVARLGGEIKKRSEDIKDSEKRLSNLRSERKNIESYDALLKLRILQRLEVEEEEARAEYSRASAGLKKQDDGGDFRLLFAKNTEYVAQCRDHENLMTALSNAESERTDLVAEAAFDSDEVMPLKKSVSNYEKTSKILFVSAVLMLIGGLLFYFASGNAAGLLGIGVSVALAAVGGVFIGKPLAIARENGFDSVSELNDALDRFPTVESQLRELDRKIERLRSDSDSSMLRCVALKRELDEGIGAFVDGAVGNYSEQIEKIIAISAESGEKLAVWRTKRDALERASEGVDRDALAEEALGATEPTRDRQIVDREINFYSSKLAQLDELNRRDELNRASLEAKSGDPAMLVGKRDSLDSLVADLTIKHRAYETAISFIEESADYMKSMVAPRISERADIYFSAATGGKYSSFEVDTKLSMSFGEDFRRSCDYLSAGTRDSAYVSLRFALADLLFGGCGVPIMLDDAFARMDDNRLRMISGAVSEASKKHQVFILTHGSRERDAMSDMGVEFSEIHLKTV